MKENAKRKGDKLDSIGRYVLILPDRNNTESDETKTKRNETIRHETNRTDTNETTRNELKRNRSERKEKNETERIILNYIRSSVEPGRKIKGRKKERREKT